ncbi:hypothetical protein B0H14DRAFT_2590242 [Mycena olivaceomarginata]|nr:hypothetical protein B0H14DRAFT_2590242 [Mycena olivaceomarginata]
MIRPYKRRDGRIFDSKDGVRDGKHRTIRKCTRGLDGTVGSRITESYNCHIQLQPGALKILWAMEYFTSFATSGAPVAANGITWAPSADINGSPRILLHPGNISLENVIDALSTRCAFWHDLASEINT